MESGQDNITLITIARLVEGFGVDVQELLAPVEDGSDAIG